MLALPRFISPPRQPRPSRPLTTFASLRTAAQGLSKSAPSPVLGEKSARPSLPPRSFPPAAHNRHQLFAAECARLSVPCLALVPVDESEAEEDGLEEALDALLDRARAEAPKLPPRPPPQKKRNLRKAPFRPRLTPIDELEGEEVEAIASSAASDSLSSATSSSILSLSLSSSNAGTPASTPSSSCPTSPTKTSSAPALRAASLSSSRTTTSPTVANTRTTRLLTLLRTLAPRPTLAALRAASATPPARPRRSKQASLTSRSSSSSSTIAPVLAPKESWSAWARDREGARAALRGRSAGRGRGEEEQEKREGKCVRRWWRARAVGLGAHEERLKTEVKMRGEEGVKVRVEVEEEWIEWAGL
ncbi:hypothetical protein JCM10450v2_004437 [Rhodotorula kratochvilovae]